MTKEELSLVEMYRKMYKERAFEVALEDYREKSLTFPNVVKQLGYDSTRVQKVESFKQKLASYQS
jgi:hypothetical protein